MYNKAGNAITVGIGGMMLYNLLHLVASLVLSKYSIQLGTGGLFGLAIAPFTVSAVIYLWSVRDRPVEAIGTVLLSKPMFKVFWYIFIILVLFLFVTSVLPDVWRRFM